LKPQALWLPGDFPTTNKLLDLTRASGFYAGNRRQTGARKRPNELEVNDLTAKIRGDVKLRARAARLVPVVEAAPLLFVHFGSGRRDPSSWYLSAKAVEDGLTDAGVLPSDRFSVTCTGGWCVKASDPVWQGEVSRLCGVETRGLDGMLVCVGVPSGFFPF
jgi:hypothetical protein